MERDEYVLGSWGRDEFDVLQQVYLEHSEQQEVRSEKKVRT